MKGHVQRLGDSLAVCIPSSLAAQSGLSENTPVELQLVGGNIVIAPHAPRKKSLEELLSGITPDNLHGEWETGPDVGAEVV